VLDDARSLTNPCQLTHTGALRPHEAGWCCGAWNPKRQKHCGQRAGQGTDHLGDGSCKVHFGNSPNHERAAQNERARRAVATYGLPVQIDAIVALEQEIWRTHGHVLWLTEVIQELNPDALVWGVTKRSTKTGLEQGTVDTESEEQAAAINIWLELYRAERKHLLAVTSEAIRCGIAERQVKILEQQGRMFADALTAIFGDPALGLSEEQKEASRRVVSRHLHALPELTA
jgi:hypothetical protein